MRIILAQSVAIFIEESHVSDIHNRPVDQTYLCVEQDFRTTRSSSDVTSQIPVSCPDVRQSSVHTLTDTQADTRTRHGSARRDTGPLTATGAAAASDYCARGQPAANTARRPLTSPPGQPISSRRRRPPTNRRRASKTMGSRLSNGSDKCVGIVAGWLRGSDGRWPAARPAMAAGRGVADR